MRRFVLIVCAGLALGAAGCSAPGTQELAQDAVQAMGGERVRNLQNYVMRGGRGSRSAIGQQVRTGEPDVPAQLLDVEETLDLAGNRAALEYEIQTASGFSQHRQEVLTRQGDRTVGLERVGGRPLAVMSASGLFSWGTQNSPGMALKRSVVALALMAARTVSSNRTENRLLNGRVQRFGITSLGGDSVGFYFDPDSKLITGFETDDTETILGDVRAQYVLEDYRDVGGVKLPHKITIRKAGQPYADVQFASAAVDDAEAMRVFTVPDDASPETDRVLGFGADYSPVRLIQVANQVFFAQAYSHNSLIVEFPTFLAVVEAPYTEAQSKTLVKQLTMQFPRKPVRYVAVTHPHFDHVGGVRGMVARGATVIAARAHESALRALIDAPHSNPPDDLATNRTLGRQVGSLQTFEEKRVITEAGQSLELYVIKGSPHVDSMVVAYVPSTHVLFQSDLFFPGTGGASTPEAEHLLKSVRSLNLRVDRNAGGHGGVNVFSELVKAVGPAGTN
ncbi:MAG TPA: MBL fold metallo-hydrolase [Vicinamibacterales bacterium]|nr:MBL fold metallo-hydrolase [Vicinamibacterales bacterium]